MKNFGSSFTSWLINTWTFPKRATVKLEETSFKWVLPWLSIKFELSISVLSTHLHIVIPSSDFQFLASIVSYALSLVEISIFFFKRLFQKDLAYEMRKRVCGSLTHQSIKKTIDPRKYFLRSCMNDHRHAISFRPCWICWAPEILQRISRTFQA